MKPIALIAALATAAYGGYYVGKESMRFTIVEKLNGITPVVVSGMSEAMDRFNREVTTPEQFRQEMQTALDFAAIVSR